MHENLANLILTSEEYKDTPFAKAEKQRSYVFEIEKAGKKIVYFGCSHINDPEDLLFDEIKKKFDEAKPEMVYIEGIHAANSNKEKFRDYVKRQDYEEVKKEGEPHFVLKLAVEAGINFESPEPEFSQEIIFMVERGFSKKDIFYFYMYRVIDQYQRKNKIWNNKDCENYLTPYYNRFCTESGWEQKDLDQMFEIIIAELEINNPEKYKREVDPIPWEGMHQTVLNEISRSSSNFRDRYIFMRIAEGLKIYNKIFVVYGSAHAVKQEPAFLALLENDDDKVWYNNHS